MPLTVEWDDGVAIRYGRQRVVFDPQRNNHSYPRVFITHAHLDHSKGFGFKDSQKFSTKETKDVIAAYGKKIRDWQPLEIEGRISVDNMEVVSHNSGHILGSALFEAVTPKGTVVYTGDLQFTDSFTMKGAKPISCDVLVIDSTFGSKTFKFPNRETVAREMVQWALETINKGKVPTFRTDSLGNAQEVTKAFNMYSNLPVVVHQRVSQINEIYASNGHSLKFLDGRSEEARQMLFSGECIFIVPKNLTLKDHPELELALVSGWALWTKKTAFALSDHADFGQLIEFIKACNPTTVFTCFGGRRNHTFAGEVERILGIEARPLKLIPTRFVI